MGAMMGTEDNKILVSRFFEEVFSKHNLAEADRVIAADYVLHDPTAPDLASGPEAWKKFHARYLKAFPDHHLRIEEQVAEGEIVATRWQMQGAHRGDLPGIPATGKKIAVTGITISRIRGGKIVEEWRDWDTLGLLQQLGVVCPPA
jgi:steroid delta-isomerase-like uncharacterized protein